MLHLSLSLAHTLSLALALLIFLSMVGLDGAEVHEDFTVMLNQTNIGNNNNKCVSLSISRSFFPTLSPELFVCP